MLICTRNYERWKWFKLTSPKNLQKKSNSIKHTHQKLTHNNTALPFHRPDPPEWTGLHPMSWPQRLGMSAILESWLHWGTPWYMGYHCQLPLAVNIYFIYNWDSDINLQCIWYSKILKVYKKKLITFLKLLSYYDKVYIKTWFKHSCVTAHTIQSTCTNVTIYLYNWDQIYSLPV